MTPDKDGYITVVVGGVTGSKPNQNGTIYPECSMDEVALKVDRKSIVEQLLKHPNHSLSLRYGNYGGDLDGDHYPKRIGDKLVSWDTISASGFGRGKETVEVSALEAI